MCHGGDTANLQTSTKLVMTGFQTVWKNQVDTEIEFACCWDAFVNFVESFFLWIKFLLKILFVHCWKWIVSLCVRHLYHKNIKSFSPSISFQRKIFSSASTCIEKAKLPCWPQKVSRCHTRDESEESIARRRESTQAKDPLWLWNPWLASPEVQNRGTSDPTKRTYVFRIFF